MNFIEERSGVPVKNFSVGSGGLAVAIDVSTSGVNHENGVLLRRNKNTWVIKVRDTVTHHCWHVSALI